MASSRALASLIPGSLIAGRYTVDHALGKGGMGTVYAVRDAATGERLALKFLQREAARENGPAAALFQREYHTLSQLRHPRVIQVYDYGVDGGRPFFTMEMLDGSDLRELAPLPWRRACQLLRDVAFSLALLHSRRLLHRDLSPRNVRCTRDGQAKLIDFVTMAPMGIAKDVAGTPPYMAPEAVHGQVLDARTDLYALGALAYWTLTGYDAYPARDARELRQLWPHPILPPSATARDLPEALDALVMSLLGLDPQARPSHVAEVIERLTAIASLDPVDQREMARAYLTSPTLVGHTDTLASFSKRLVRASRGRGSALLIRGAAGAGRSRLLQTLVLEAKLSGVQVLTADAEDAQSGELGVVRAWVDALALNAPDVALVAFRPYADVLGGLFPKLYDQLEHPPPLVSAESSRAHAARVLQEVRDFLIRASQMRPLMVALDDADRVDETSLACLTLLAGDARTERIVVAATVENGSAQNKALELLATEAARIELAPLIGEQTHRLLRSVFGDAPHLQVVTEWAHMLAQGSPRTVLELAQYLVDHGIARYERGSWILPETLRDQALPQSIEQAVDELLRSLSPDARGLAEGLALVTEHGHLELDELVGLSVVRSTQNMFAAVDELIVAQIVVASASKHHLRHRGLARALRKSMSEPRRKQLHLRLSALYEAREGAHADRPLLVAYHRRLGGDVAGCFQALAAAPPPALDAAFGRTREAAAMYEACLAYAEEAGMSPARSYPLRKALLALTAAGDPSLIKHVEPALAQLSADSGRIYFEQQREGDPAQRIRQAIRKARSAREAMPEDKRGLPASDAVQELGSAALLLIETYVVRCDAEGLTRLVDLIAPFRPLSPVFDLICDMSQNARDSLLGYDVAEARAQTLARLAQPMSQLGPSQQLVLRSVITYFSGMDDAALGKETALVYAGELEQKPLYAPLAAQIRSIYHLFAGDEAEAEVWQKRRELLGLQARYIGISTTPGVLREAFGYYACGSVLGMRRVLQTIAQLAARYEGWERERRRVEGLYALLRGEPAVALPLLRGLDDSAEMRCLLQLGELDQARVVADRSASKRTAERPLHPMLALRAAASRALVRAAGGDSAAAVEELEREIKAAEQDGVTGMLACTLYEARARVAIQMDDRVAFKRYIRKLGATYGRGTSGLRARYEQLSLAARRALMSVPPQPLPREEADHSSMVTAQVASLPTSEQRFARALRLLTSAAKSQRGFLFGMQKSGLRLAACLGETEAPEGMIDMLAFFLNAELDSTEAVPHTVTGMFASAPDMVAWINDGQHLYYPVLLSCVNGSRRVVSAVAAIALPVQRTPDLSAELLSELSRSLLEAGDVVGANAAD
jgi:predicted Ser/Thr protein kinase